ncbi:MAG: hypothetical protein Unbinned4466contig1000_63 [Prokaryotic dsDNA virus sp.]|nr:MAG: hypothetical protein Unbinned4466contig1000_63 [Prokaryotic dsDNA virus sp.]|tara:strand:- start:1528 stop:2043 length:516 start_codon:yes stop_codon:yes gene_type:complete
MNIHIIKKDKEGYERAISKLEKQFQLASEDNDYLQDCIEDLNEQLRIKEGIICNLEIALTKSTDQNDLLLDEFIRVKLLTDNTEIHALCERAHVRMRQNVSVIDRNERLKEEVKKLSADMIKMIDIAQDALNMAGKTSHGGTIYVGEDPNFAKQSLQKSLDKFKSVYGDYE